MKYYIVYRPDKALNKFLECENENELIKDLQKRKGAMLSDYDVYLKII
jgi:hypothetical protein